MAAVKRNDPKKRPVPAVEKLGKRPGAAAAPARTKARPSRAEPRRGRDDADRRAPRDDVDGPQFFGGPKNEFGTRVARRITCSRCGAVDHVPHAPRKLERALCRACAADVLNTYEVGTRAKVETRPAACSLCKKPFALPVKVELTDEILCPDCLRGFATWTGGIDTAWDERRGVVIEARVSGTLVRRRKK